MPRIARIVATGYPHHITQRGNNRTVVFLDDDDRQAYLDFLVSCAQKHSLDILAYCLMNDHLHLLAIPNHESSLSKGVGLANQLYTQYFNCKHGSSGRVWQNRFFSCVVEHHHYLWSVLRYIVNNPVKKGLVKRAEDYNWSSARGHLLGEEDELLGGEQWLDPQELPGFRSFVKEQNSYIESAIRKATSTGRPFGSADFVSMLEDRLQIPIKTRRPGRPRKNLRP